MNKKHILALILCAPLPIIAQTQNTNSTVVITTTDDGKVKSRQIEAYENGKKLPAKKAHALAKQLQNQQNSWNKHWRAFNKQMNQWANNIPNMIVPEFNAMNRPLNLHTAKQQIKDYVKSGQYMADIRYVTMRASNYLSSRVIENKSLAKPKKLAVVFDIDETVLSNYPTMLKMNFGGELKNIIRAEDNGKDPAITPSLNLFNLTKKDNVAIFFITGRKPFERAITVKNLKDAGYKGWTKIYFKPSDYKEHSAAPYKTGIRKKITKQGYDIVFSMGDQFSDLRGGYADRLFKLPNPFYYIP